MYLVGIDVGTTNTKTVIFDVETGHICAVGSCRSIVRHPVAEWSEFDAEDLWETVIKSIKIAIQHCDRPERIRAISVASMGESAFPLDADGNVLYAAIAWYDGRAAEEAKWWENTVGRERIFTITGQIPHSMFGVNKLLWLRNHARQVFERIHSWLSIEDFVLWKLSGNFATDIASPRARCSSTNRRSPGQNHFSSRRGCLPSGSRQPFPVGPPLVPCAKRLLR